MSEHDQIGHKPIRTREEHLAWCKARALEYLPAEPQQALTSMWSDLETHPETAGHGANELGMMMLMSGLLKSPSQVRNFINGYN